MQLFNQAEMLMLKKTAISSQASNVFKNIQQVFERLPKKDTTMMVHFQNAPAKTKNKILIFTCL